MWNFVENCILSIFVEETQVFWLIFRLIPTISTNSHMEIEEKATRNNLLGLMGRLFKYSKNYDFETLPSPSRYRYSVP